MSRRWKKVSDGRTKDEDVPLEIVEEVEQLPVEDQWDLLSMFEQEHCRSQAARATWPQRDDSKGSSVGREGAQSKGGYKGKDSKGKKGEITLVKGRLAKPLQHLGQIDRQPVRVYRRHYDKEQGIFFWHCADFEQSVWERPGREERRVMDTRDSDGIPYSMAEFMSFFPKKQHFEKQWKNAIPMVLLSTTSIIKGKGKSKSKDSKQKDGGDNSFASSENTAKRARGKGPSEDEDIQVSSFSSPWPVSFYATRGKGKKSGSEQRLDAHHEMSSESQKGSYSTTTESQRSLLQRRRPGTASSSSGPDRPPLRLIERSEVLQRTKGGYRDDKAPTTHSEVPIDRGKKGGVDSTESEQRKEEG